MNSARSDFNNEQRLMLTRARFTDDLLDPTAARGNLSANNHFVSRTIHLNSRCEVDDIHLLHRWRRRNDRATNICN